MTTTTTTAPRPGAGAEAVLAALAPDERPAVELLRELIRIDTTNPPGNERLAADLVAERLRQEGLEPVVIEAAPGRASLVVRLKGDGSLGGPLLLNAHLDVVTAGDPARWAHPPFSAAIEDGYIYGRGCVDMKHMAALSVEVLLRLHREQARLGRDLIVSLVADEEEGSDHGARHLVDHHPDLVRAEYAFGEVGGFTLHIGKARFYPIMVAEKGIAWLRVTAHGEAGHGSMPNRDSAVVRLARAVARIGRARLPQHNTPVVEEFIGRIATRLGLPQSAILRTLLNPRLSGPVLDHVFPDRALARPFFAALSNTASPTVLSAGDKTNVIPGEAEALLDGRTLPGQTAADLVAELKALLGKDGHELNFEILREAPPVVTTAETPVFSIIREVIERHDPGALVVPYMIPGFTDAKAYSRLGTVCYGFCPVKLPPGLAFNKLYHGDNERIPVDGVIWGLRVLDETVRRVCVKR